MSTILNIQSLSKTYWVSAGWFNRNKKGVKALNNLSLAVEKGETLGIVGESGCGKSTLARMLVGLLEPSEGQLSFENEPSNSGGQLGQHIQYVFQDPISSLNPRRTIQASMEAPLKALHQLPKTEREERIREAFNQVSLREEFLERYPHEFSGGQAQRIGIARALVAKPEILVLDEPVSALDVSVQAQVLNLLADIKEENNLTYLFISHDLAVVEAVSDRVAVMYFGTLVELGRAEQIFKSPKHPYTKLLAESAPVVGRAIQVPDKDAELPDPLNPPKGCAFASRCPNASHQCMESVPKLNELEGNQFVACHHPVYQ
ncbi:oligopeptide transport ATP-binding protein AppF [Vibrio nigripulchritudo]|uniref:ABC transporter ATP-binding protein n=1 Tax=Vibrio nigripulchritudo TaxID=28173 RepID=UPI00190CBC38|nr:oligopeptide/dipeptide ABC transporter ATP-binding protein [Vibrio nigripulchritudo]BCL72196.1 oligopeptide transport ATP-binding protein AppF [Vibrio nigripulchritudo]BDU33554.1 oligopeptide transport ATP-binding protein AppF [Vibrio nigripulchritudo]